MNKPIKILIIANWYPPDRRVPARRWGNLVAYLSEHGVDCTVICAGDGVYRDYMGIYGERVIRLAISNRAARSSVEPKRKNPSIKNIIKARLAFVIPPILRDRALIRWLTQLYSSNQFLAIACESDCIICSYGPVGPLFMGWLLARKAKRPWVMDIRDSFESRDGNASGVAKLLSRRFEKWLLREANMRITIGKTLSDYLSSIYKNDFLAVYNGWTEDDIVKPHKKRSEEMYLYYAGSIYDQRIPALAIVFEAIQNNPRIKLRIRLLNDQTNGLFAELLGTVTRPEKIELLPPVDQNIVDEELAGSIGALVVEEIGEHDDMRNGTVTGKLMGLLASGKPGIAVSSPKGEIRQLVDNVPGWYGVNTVEQCQQALEKLLSYPMTGSRPQSLMEFHMSKQAGILLELVQKTLVSINRP